MSTDAVARRTGKTWDDWFAVLDNAGNTSNALPEYYVITFTPGTRMGVDIADSGGPHRHFDEVAQAAALQRFPAAVDEQRASGSDPLGWHPTAARC